MNIIANLENQFKRVWHFQDAFNCPQHGYITQGDMEYRILRYRLQDEEFEELCKAIALDDYLEIADGIIDGLYIAIGSLLYHGFLNDNTTITYIKDLYENYPDYVEYYSDEEFDSYEAELSFLLYHFKENYDPKNRKYTIQIPLVEIQSYLCRIIVNLILLWEQYERKGIFKEGYFEDAFLEVHNSNMSKLENGKPVYFTQGDKKGKVKKGKSYKKPNLSQFVNI